MLKHVETTKRENLEVKISVCWLSRLDPLNIFESKSQVSEKISLIFTFFYYRPFHTVSNSEDMGQSVRMVPVRRSHPAKDVAAWRQKSHPPWPTEALPIPPGVLLCRRFRSAHQLHPATKLEVAIICNHSNNSDD